MSLLYLIGLLVIGAAYCDPLLSSWKQTTQSGKGYNGITGGIQKIQYSSSYVYIYTSGIPSYTIGPTWSNPNTPSDQKFWFKFTRSPSVATSKTAVSLGHFGVWLSGVPIYNSNDGQTYNSLGVWNRNAYYFEGSSFDSCNGHADASKEYHIHVNPVCDYTSVSTSHSPILGYAFDGYPIYGPYAYSSALDMTSSIKRMVSSYAKRSITQRQTLANGTTLSSTYYGPDVSTTYPLGCFLEDYVYTSGYGDLDEYNGRNTKTVDYTSGTYAYYVTIDESGTPAYPFVIGPNYYGTPLILRSYTTSPSETVTTYFSFSNAYYTKSSLGLVLSVLMLSLKNYFF